MADKVVVEHLYKVFGEHPQDALRLLEQGVDKDEIFARTGQTVGVCDASFSIRTGEIFVIMGLSGSGKSTLVRLLNRLIEPSAGKVMVDGRDIAAMSDEELMGLRRRDMSMVFQSFALMPHLTVGQNAAFGLELAGVLAAEREQRALTALDQVGLKSHVNSYPDELSGGMQQRVGLARALANNPSVMLMDEAFSALDPLIRSEMQDELLKLQEHSERTIIFISHDLDEAMRIGDRIAIMEGGRVVQVGTPDDILNNPSDDYVRSFFRGVDVASVFKAGDIARRTQVTVIERRDDGLRAALNRLREHDREFGYVVDKGQHFHGVVSIDSLQRELRQAEPRLQHAFLRDVPTLAADTCVSESLGTVAATPCGVPVVDAHNRYRGVITKACLLQTLDRDSDTAASPKASQSEAALPELAALGHERLEVYPLAIAYAAWVYQKGSTLQGLHRTDADQWLLASRSVPLNIAAGHAKTAAADRMHHFETARGAALDCVAIQDMLVATQALTEDESRRRKIELDRMIALLEGLDQEAPAVDAAFPEDNAGQPHAQPAAHADGEIDPVAESALAVGPDAAGSATSRVGDH